MKRILATDKIIDFDDQPGIPFGDVMRLRRLMALHPHEQRLATFRPAQDGMFYIEAPVLDDIHYGVCKNERTAIIVAYRYNSSRLRLADHFARRLQRAQQAIYLEPE